MSTSNTGFNISGYPTALVNRVNKINKLQYDHYLMSYAVTNSGLSAFNKNYKVPVHALREDFKSYIGFENAKGQWRQLTRFWVGDWYKENEIQNNKDETVKSGDKVNSYLYNWSLKEIGHEDYILNKFGDEKHEGHADVLPTERIFIVKNAPIPCEYNYATLFVKRDKDGNPVKDKDGNLIRVEVNEDPYPNLAKIVDKNYIDNRFNGIRIVNVDDTVGAVIEDYDDGSSKARCTSPTANGNEIYSEDTSIHDYPIVFGNEDTAFLRIRPYTCIYELTKPVKCIHIFDDLNCGNGKTTRESLMPEIADGKDSKLERNFLTFFVKLPRPVGQDAVAIDKQGIVFLVNKDVEERKVTEKSSAIDTTTIQNEQTSVTEKYSPSVRWSFLGERHRVIKQAWLAGREVFIKCEAYYSNDGKLNIICTSAVSYDQGTSIPEYISGYACNDFRHKANNRFATSSLLYKHTFSDGKGDESILDNLWNVEKPEQGTYADNVNSIHVSNADRKSWEDHVADSKKGSMLLTSSDDFAIHHFRKDEKKDWLEEIYDRVQYIGVDTNSDDYISIQFNRNSYKPGITNPDTEDEGDSTNTDTEGDSTNTEGTDNSSTTTPDESGVATVSLTESGNQTETGSQYIPSPIQKIATISLNTTDVMSLGKPSEAAIPTTHALYAHAFDWREGVDGKEPYKPNYVTYQPLHVTQQEKDRWNSFSNLEAGHCIHISEADDNDVKTIDVLTVKSAEDIRNADANIMANTVPTTGAVKAYAEGAGGIQYEDKKEDETEAPKSTNFRFLGSHVHRVVEYVDGKPLVKLYFGPNNNPPSIGVIEYPKTTAMCLYEADSSSARYKNYTLPEGFVAEDDATYDCLYPTGATIKKIHIKGVDKNDEHTDEFIIPVKLPKSEKDSDNLPWTEQNQDCVTLELIYISPTSSDKSTTVSCAIPIKINSSGKYECDTSSASVEVDENGKYIIHSNINNGLQLNLYDIIINQKSDADDGYLPDVVRAKGYVSINTSDNTLDNTALAKVGSYKLRITTSNGNAITDKQIFVYESLTDPDDYKYGEQEEKLTADLSFVGGATKQVSGITYYNTGKMNVTINNIKYTQPYVTPNTNRIKLNWSKGKVTNTNTDPNATITTTNIPADGGDEIITKQLLTTSSTSGSSSSVSSIFKYTSATDKHKITSSGDVAKFEMTLNNVSIYKQNGSTVKVSNSPATVSSATVTEDKYIEYIWTPNTSTSNKPNKNIITFNTDNDFSVDNKGQKTYYYRYLNAFDPEENKFLMNEDKKDPTSSKYKYDSSKSLLTETDYQKELLVQGDWLKHPAKDLTSTYSTAKNTRCYVRRIEIDSSSDAPLGKIKITVANIKSNYYISTEDGSSIVNFYLAEPGNPQLLHLNAKKDYNYEGDIVRVGIPDEIENNSWTFQTFSNALWPIYGTAKGKAYYLIVTMTKDAEKIGKITITKE